MIKLIRLEFWQFFSACSFLHWLFWGVPFNKTTIVLTGKYLYDMILCIIRVSYKEVIPWKLSWGTVN